MSHSVVIGGAGFVGSWVVEELLKKPESKVTIIDNLISSERWNISTNSRVTFIEGSATDFDTFEKINAPVDTLFQLACFHGNQSSIARPLDDLENGLKTTLVTLEWVKRNSPKTRIIYSGAGCAVAEKTWQNPTPVKEIDFTSLRHDSPYSISKITGEMYCLFYAQSFNMDVIRVRFQNVYGPREILGAGKWRGTMNTIWRNVIPTFVYKSIKNLPIEIYGSNASRDFVFVEDIAEGILKAAKHGTSQEVFNLASGTEIMINDLASDIILLADSNSKIILREKREWDNSGRRFGSTIKARETIAFSAKTPIREGLKKTIQWSLNNLELIEKTIEKHSSETTL